MPAESLLASTNGKSWSGLLTTVIGVVRGIVVEAGLKPVADILL